jgi:hypothetical protein
VAKRDLQREGFLGVDGPDRLWWRPRGAASYRPFGHDDLRALRETFRRAGHLARLDG